jgi:hypothetical protein
MLSCDPNSYKGKNSDGAETHRWRLGPNGKEELDDPFILQSYTHCAIAANGSPTGGQHSVLAKGVWRNWLIRGFVHALLSLLPHVWTWQYTSSTHEVVILIHIKATSDEGGGQRPLQFELQWTYVTTSIYTSCKPPYGIIASL